MSPRLGVVINALPLIYPIAAFLELAIFKSTFLYSVLLAVLTWVYGCLLTIVSHILDYLLAAAANFVASIPHHAEATFDFIRFASVHLYHITIRLVITTLPELAHCVLIRFPKRFVLEVVPELIKETLCFGGLVGICMLFSKTLQPDSEEEEPIRPVDIPDDSSKRKEVRRYRTRNNEQASSSETISEVALPPTPSSSPTRITNPRRTRLPPDYRPRIPDFKPRVSEFTPRISESIKRISESKQRTSESKQRTSESKQKASDSKPSQVPESSNKSNSGLLPTPPQTPFATLVPRSRKSSKAKPKEPSSDSGSSSPQPTSPLPKPSLPVVISPPKFELPLEEPAEDLPSKEVKPPLEVLSDPSPSSSRYPGTRRKVLQHLRVGKPRRRESISSTSGNVSVKAKMQEGLIGRRRAELIFRRKVTSMEVDNDRDLYWGDQFYSGDPMELGTPRINTLPLLGPSLLPRSSAPSVSSVTSQDGDADSNETETDTDVRMSVAFPPSTTASPGPSTHSPGHSPVPSIRDIDMLDSFSPHPDRPKSGYASSTESSPLSSPNPSPVISTPLPGKSTTTTSSTSGSASASSSTSTSSRSTRTSSSKSPKPDIKGKAPAHRTSPLPDYERTPPMPTLTSPFVPSDELIARIQEEVQRTMDVPLPQDDDFDDDEDEVSTPPPRAPSPRRIPKRTPSLPPKHTPRARLPRIFRTRSHTLPISILGKRVRSAEDDGTLEEEDDSEPIAPPARKRRCQSAEL